MRLSVRCNTGSGRGNDLGCCIGEPLAALLRLARQEKRRVWRALALRRLHAREAGRVRRLGCWRLLCSAPLVPLPNPRRITSLGYSAALSLCRSPLWHAWPLYTPIRSVHRPTYCGPGSIVSSLCTRHVYKCHFLSCWSASCAAGWPCCAALVYQWIAFCVSFSTPMPLS